MLQLFLATRNRPTWSRCLRYSWLAALCTISADHYQFACFADEHASFAPSFFFFVDGAQKRQSIIRQIYHTRNTTQAAQHSTSMKGPLILLHWIVSCSSPFDTENLSKGVNRQTLSWARQKGDWDGDQMMKNYRNTKANSMKTFKCDKMPNGFHSIRWNLFSREKIWIPRDALVPSPVSVCGSRSFGARRVLFVRCVRPQSRKIYFYS